MRGSHYPASEGAPVVEPVKPYWKVVALIQVVLLAILVGRSCGASAALDDIRDDCKYSHMFRVGTTTIVCKALPPSTEYRASGT